MSAEMPNGDLGEDPRMRLQRAHDDVGTSQWKTGTCQTVLAVV